MGMAAMIDMYLTQPHVAILSIYRAFSSCTHIRSYTLIAILCGNYQLYVPVALTEFSLMQINIYNNNYMKIG